MGASGSEQNTPARNTFVGRERELAELEAACEAGADSDTHLFLIHGEPGIGKTRLADELASRAKASGVQVLWGRCWEGGGAPAYWPWIQVIRTFLGALDPERRKLVLESEIAADTIHSVAQIVPDLRHAQSHLRPSAVRQSRSKRSALSPVRRSHQLSQSRRPLASDAYRARRFARRR
jgi:predicted ATPase